MTTVVYDTNVIVSGLFWKGAPQRLLRAAREKRVQLVISQSLIDELRKTITRSDKSFRVANATATIIISDILKYSRFVVPTREISVCRDPKDNMVLACAIEGQVEYLVTGDPDLLVLKTFESVKIVTVREFAEVINA
jgi:uncharacterized protein